MKLKITKHHYIIIYSNFPQQPSGLLAFLESTEAPPAAALANEIEPERDNLQLAQASVKTRAQHWEALERQVKYVEKHLEVSQIKFNFDIECCGSYLLLQAKLDYAQIIAYLSSREPLKLSKTNK